MAVSFELMAVSFELMAVSFEHDVVISVVSDSNVAIRTLSESTVSFAIEAELNKISIAAKTDLAVNDLKPLPIDEKNEIQVPRCRIVIFLQYYNYLTTIPK
jgi:hypothetical protein